MAFTFSVIILWENIPISLASFDLLSTKEFHIFYKYVLRIILVFCTLRYVILLFLIKRDIQTSNIIIEQNKMSKMDLCFHVLQKYYWHGCQLTFIVAENKKDLHPDECMFPELYIHIYDFCEMFYSGRAIFMNFVHRSILYE